VTAIARAYRHALSGRGAAQLLDYGDPQGLLRLRAALAEMLSATRGLSAGPESLIVTRGSQMGLYLVSRALIAPGDVVAVEALGYRPAWEALKQTGARLVPLPVDGAGLDVDALAEWTARERVRAVYVTPHHQYPTTATLSAGRRLQLLELARKERMIVIEDDYDHEFHYDGRPILPLASADEAGVVVYIGTLSKILAPGLRLGYVAATAEVVGRLAARRLFIDRQGDQAMECAIAQLLEDGEVQRHARRARRVYQSRRDTLVQALTDELGGVLTFQQPIGGIALWARAEGGLDVDAWVERCREREVHFQVARRFAFDGRPRNFVRLGFASCNETELREAVRRMASVC
jgi:GntR family transcriptional regulator/MocR family aminotransferase